MKTQFVKNAQTQFLRDTVKFYNSKNRATKPSSTACIYSPTPDSPGCAIGRHVSNKLICREWDTVGSLVSLGEMADSGLGGLLVLGKRFLRDVQSLHDDFACWGESGLSERGEINVRGMCLNYGLNMEEVLK